MAGGGDETVNCTPRLSESQSNSARHRYGYASGRRLGYIEGYGTGGTERDVMAKILIVEDNNDNMKLFRTILTLKHHEIIERADGERLKESIGDERPDLVLMDIQLPGQDGFSLLESIRSSAVPDCRVVSSVPRTRPTGSPIGRSESIGEVKFWHPAIRPILYRSSMSGI